MPPPPSRWRDRVEIRKIRGNFRVQKMKKPVKAETTVNPPLLRSGMQNACTYSDTGCVGGSICAADAAAYIPVNTDAKVSTTQKRPPCRVVFLCGGDNWNHHPLFTAFHAFPTPLGKPHSHALFRASRVCTHNRKNTNFPKIRVRFVYGSMGRGAPAHRF